MIPTPWRLIHAANNEACGCDLIRQWLREYNWKANPAFMEKFQQVEHQARPLVLLAEVEGAVIGGLFAETQLSWLRTSIMSVHPDMRGQGVGAALLAEAEREAINRKCRYAYVDTMEYQAPAFYEACGYAIVGEIPDWDSHGHRKFHLTKTL